MRTGCCAAAIPPDPNKSLPTSEAAARPTDALTIKSRLEIVPFLFNVSPGVPVQAKQRRAARQRWHTPKGHTTTIIETFAADAVVIGSEGVRGARHAEITGVPACGTDVADNPTGHRSGMVTVRTWNGFVGASDAPCMPGRKRCKPGQADRATHRDVTLPLPDRLAVQVPSATCCWHATCGSMVRSFLIRIPGKNAPNGHLSGCCYFYVKALCNALKRCYKAAIDASQERTFAPKSRRQTQ